MKLRARERVGNSQTRVSITAPEAAGALRCLKPTKPFTAQALVRKVRQLLNAESKAAPASTPV